MTPPTTLPKVFAVPPIKQLITVNSINHKLLVDRLNRLLHNEAMPREMRKRFSLIRTGLSKNKWL